MLSFFLFISCVRKKDGYRITDIHMQRIEFDDSTFNDKIIYVLNTECEMTEKLKLWSFAPATEFTENGCYDSIKGLFIEDSASNIITDSLSPFTTKELSPHVHIEDSNRIVFYKTFNNWERILSHLQHGVPYDADNIFLYANKDAPQPTSVTIKFSDHEIKARVNNTPVKYSIIKRE